MDKEWIEQRIEKLNNGIAAHQNDVQQKSAEIKAHNAQIQNNMGAIAILNEQLEVIDAAAADHNAT